MATVGKIEVWARPGSRQKGIEWDAWRKCWVVSVHEPPAGGRANEAIVRIVAEQLNVPRSSVRLVSGVRTRAKLVEVDGLSVSEIAERLHRRRGRRAVPLVPNGIPSEAHLAKGSPDRVGRAAPGQLHGP